MNLKELLEGLRQHRVHLWSEGEQIRVRAPKGRLTDEFRTAISTHRVELLSLVRGDMRSRKAARKEDRPHAVARTGTMPLSSAEQRLWFLHQLEGDSVAYSLPSVSRLRGALDLEALQGALDDLVQRQEALRTRYTEVEGNPVRIIEPHASLPLRIVDLSAPSKGEEAGAVREYVQNELATPFDLGCAPLLRVTVLKLADDDFVLLVSMHHIISDGWSMAVLVREFSTLYSARILGRPSGLPDLDLHYADFACWQRARLDAGALKPDLGYWEEHLRDAPPLLELPTSRPRGAVQSFRGAMVQFSLPASCVRTLRALGQEEGATLFMTLLAAYKVLLRYYSGQPDIVVGTSVANRSRAELENILGFFVNSLALRTDLSDDPTFRELLRRVRRVALDGFAHEDVPFERVVEALSPERTLSQTPIFQVMFDLHNTPDIVLDLPGVEVSSLDFEGVVAKFELSLDLHENESGIAGTFEYNTDLFDAPAIRRMVAHYTHLLQSIVADPERRVSRLDIVPPADQARAIHEWNDTARHGHELRPVHAQIALQAAKTPDRIAVSAGGRQVSYRALDRRSNEIAHALRAAHVDVEQRVALYIDRGVDYITAMLGVLKAGAAFVPVDVDAPVEYSRSILEECAPAVLLAMRESAARVSELAPSATVLFLEDVFAQRFPRTAPPERTSPRSLAYVIYTSGSTGRPKGAMIEHAGMSNHNFAHIVDQGFTGSDVVGQIARATFDVSVWQCLCVLIVGGRTAVLTGDEAWEPSALLPALRREKVTILQSVPSHTQVILDEVEANPHRLPCLRWYMTHAEALTVAQCTRWFRHFPNIALINGYGATEVSDDSSQYHLFAAPELNGATVPLAGVLANLTTYVLDPAMRPAAVGVCGDIHIGGTGVGRGYLGRPDLTGRVFVPDPFSKEPGARLYRVGDLGRYLDDGRIEFLGRSDFQVRIRGFRVEVGEVEAALRHHVEVADAVAMARKDGTGSSRLVGYVVPTGYPAPSPAQLTSFLRERLSHHQVPSHFVYLDALPLSKNGKVDRKLLPAPEWTGSVEGGNYAPPRDENEAALAAMWGEVLGQRVGIFDSFFELGGHSLAAAQLVIRMRRELGRDIALRALFEAPTIDAFAKRIYGEDAGAAGTQAVDRALARVRRYPDEAYTDLAPAQIPIWYQCTLVPDSIVYNVSYGNLSFIGHLDFECFARAWEAFFARHRSFRSRFTFRDGRPVQYFSEPIAIRVEDIYVDRRGLSDEERQSETSGREAEMLHARFDLEHGPLYRLRAVDYGGGHYQVQFSTHHIIWDETSLMNTFREVGELYNAFLAGREPVLPQLDVQYTDYIRWMQESLANGDFAEDRRYWREIFQTTPAALDLPTDFPRPPVMTANGAWIYHWLPRDIARRVDAYVSEKKVTSFMFFLAILDLYLYRLTGQTDIVIGAPIEGRDHEYFKPLVGLFATPMPIRCHIENGMTFDAFLRHVATRSIEAYEHHFYPCSKLIEELDHVKDLSRPRLFSIMYGLQNDKTGMVDTVKLDGLTLLGETTPVDASAGARFDLNFILDRVGADICFNCIYNTDLFRPETVERMLNEMTALAEAVMSDSTRPLGEYDCTTASIEPMRRFNDTAVAYDDTARLHQLFERQAVASPDHPAVVAGERTYSYRELNAWANQLARHLMDRGAGNGQRVGVLLDNSPEVLAAALAVLKSGNSYVPLGVRLPPARIEQILAEGAIDLVITQREFGSLLEPVVPRVRILEVDTEAGRIAAHSAVNVEGPGSPDDIAYVIYTSGTTGVPKGIPITHGGVVNMLESTQTDYRLTAADRLLFHTPFTFDVSIQEIFWPLAYGATIIVPPAGFSKEPGPLGRLVVDAGVTILQAVPLVLDALVVARERGEFDDPHALRLIVTGAAAVSRRLRDACRATFRCPLVNHYGPTEATVDASRMDCALDFDGDIVPIGRPIANTEMYVLDEHLRIVPLGAVGEIYVASPGLSPGYLNDLEKTRQAFIEHTFPDGTARRLYRTGDLGRIGRGGHMYFVGRKDNQVKVRGNRVELDEINCVLTEHPAVARSAVRYIQDPHRAENGMLVAFVELRDTVNEVVVASAPYRIFSIAQRPELAPRVTALGETLAGWDSLIVESPDHQWVLVDSADAIGAVVSSVPGADRRILALREHAAFAEWNASARAGAGWTYVDRDQLRAHLAQRLPDYMVPNRFCFLSKLESTESGKINEAILRDLAGGSPAAHVEAKTDLQRQLAVIWRDVLQVEDIGLVDDFFDLGGQSLKAVQVLVRVEQACGVKIRLAEFYVNSTIKGLEKLLDAGRRQP